MSHFTDVMREDIAAGVPLDLVLDFARKHREIVIDNVSDDLERARLLRDIDDLLREYGPKVARRLRP